MNKTILLLLLFGIAMFVTPSAKAVTALTCSPAPCVTPEAQVSNGGANTTVATYALAADPTSNKNLAVAANYFVDMSSCIGSGYNASWTSLFLSSNQAFSWTGGCVAPDVNDADPNWEPIAVYNSSGALFWGQLGAAPGANANGVFLHEKTGNFFSTIDFTDAGTADFYNFDFPGIAIDSSDCLYVTAWELGTKLSNNKPASAIVVGHACAPYNSWITKRVSSIITGATVASYPRVSAGADGTILVSWVQNNGGNTPKVFTSSSSDGGNTWSTPTNVFDISQTAAASCPANDPHVDRALPHTCVRMFYYPELASTNSVATGQVYHTVYPDHAGTKISINYRLSDTDGTTFTPATVLSTLAGDTGATGDQFEPCIATSGQKIGFAWLDTRNSLAGQPDSLFDAYAMTATVSEGMSGPQITFSPVHRLSTQSSGTTVQTLPSNSEYLGDWTGCAWQHGIFYYVFPSTANGTNQVAMIAGLNP